MQVQVQVKVKVKIEIKIKSRLSTHHVHHLSAYLLHILSTAYAQISSPHPLSTYYYSPVHLCTAPVARAYCTLAIS
jgi:hypothetical protein